jgi:RHH-type proline utilization regulon transcriptional repressor/proline dehydrogenase/delta 1-pyrroline-5-carboxylate dehydrogenase
LRRNSAGVEFGDQASLARLLREVREAEMPDEAAPCLDGGIRRGNRRPVHSPIDGTLVGHVSEGDEAIASTAMLAGQRGFAAWTAVPIESRAAKLELASDIIESRRGQLIRLLQMEGGKTLDDALAEVREAIDLCRYYAAEARRTLLP